MDSAYLFIQLGICGTLLCFNSCEQWCSQYGMQIAFNSLECMSKIRSAVSYGNLIFIFWGTTILFSFSDNNIKYFPLQWTISNLFRHPHLFVCFFILCVCVCTCIWTSEVNARYIHQLSFSLLLRCDCTELTTRTEYIWPSGSYTEMFIEHWVGEVDTDDPMMAEHSATIILFVKTSCVWEEYLINNLHSICILGWSW